MRDLNVYSRLFLVIFPPDDRELKYRLFCPSLLLLLGSQELTQRFLGLAFPVFGFCYGRQIMAVAWVAPLDIPRRASMARSSNPRGESRIFDGTAGQQTVWMSHRDMSRRSPQKTLLLPLLPTFALSQLWKTLLRTCIPRFHPESQPHRVRFSDAF